MGVAIARLRLRGPPERAAMARFAIEDGIRTAWPDDERLVLVRRVALGRTRPEERPDRRSVQFRQAWDAATRGRRHGGESNAGDANCVWFESRGEAWRLLLRELIAGRRPAAWFWRLAVPDWRGAPVRDWLAAALRGALAGEGVIEPVALVEAVVAEGGVDMLLAAAEQMAAVATPLTTGGSERVANAGRVVDLGPAVDAPIAAERAAIALVLAIRQNLPERLVATIERLVLLVGVASPVALGLIERLLLRGSPALRLTPEQRVAAVRAYATLLDQGVPADRGVRRTSDPAVRAARAATVSEGEVPKPAADKAGVATPPDMVPVRSETHGAPADATAVPASPSRLLDEAESAFAGLWLVVSILIRLGLRDWLAEHPDLAAADGGRRLVRAIGRHFQVDREDPALLPLAECAPGDPDFARPWRVGLDFWLWRRARIRLREVVRRQGWLRQAEERLVIRFDSDSVDLRLRRHALDVDPGWTDWLGLSIRYRYAGRGEA